MRQSINNCIKDWDEINSIIDCPFGPAIQDTCMWLPLWK